MDDIDSDENNNNDDVDKSEIMTTVMKKLMLAARNFRLETSCVLPNLVKRTGHRKRDICIANYQRAIN